MIPILVDSNVILDVATLDPAWAAWSGDAHRRRGGDRHAPLPAFYIGAHAAVAGFRLLTRDATRYRSDFPGVPLIHPT